MANTELTQAEADHLIAMEKVKLNDDKWDYPGTGGSIIVPLTSTGKRENFLLDITRGRIDFRKGKYQNRARQVVVLVRLDFGGAPHRNPDGNELPCPHLHLYREDYGAKWAFPVPIGEFSDPDDLWQTLSDFMRYCNIVDRPRIERGLFV